jgi:hypothetical protein
MKRAKIALAGLIYWCAFTPFILLTLVAQLIGIAWYACTGNDAVRLWVYRTGKAGDQLCNASLFSGNPKETISSHAGRIYQRAEASPADDFPIPRWARVVKWLTDLAEPDHVIKAI